MGLENEGVSTRRSKRLREHDKIIYYPKKSRKSNKQEECSENSADKLEDVCEACGLSIDEFGADKKCSDCISDGTYEPHNESEAEKSEEIDDDSVCNQNDKNQILEKEIKKDEISADDEKLDSSNSVEPKPELESQTDVMAENGLELCENEEGDELNECEKCKKLLLDEQNKMIACLLCLKHYHVNCLLPTDLPKDLSFDKDQVIRRKLGCVRCNTKLLPYKVSDILNWRWKEEAKSLNNPGNYYNSREFFVHYRSLSYWDCEWVTELQMEICEANLFRCFKKRNDLFTAPETGDNQLISPKKKKAKHDKDQIEYEYIRNGVEPEWLQPQRIISTTDKTCLVKWRNLGYDCLSKEPLEKTKTIPGLKELIDKFHKWKKELSNTTWKAKPKSMLKKLEVSPTYLGVSADESKSTSQSTTNTPSLHDYQLDGVNWLRSCYSNDTNTILADEMGLGKTIQAITFLYSIYKEGICRGPFLIVVPMSTIINWEREFEFWAPNFNMLFYYGEKESRVTIREKDMYFNQKKSLYKFHVLITSYELIFMDESFLTKIPWEILIVDEAHRLKNNESKLFKSFKKYNIKYRLLMTGTPLQNNLEELFNLLNFMQPSSFNDQSQFLTQFQDVSKEEQVRTLQDMLKKHLLRRLKSDVFDSLPTKQEQIVRVELTKEQKDMYRLILTKNYEELVGKFNSVKLTNVMMQLRKCCNHPYLVPLHFSDNKDMDVETIINVSGKMIIMRKMIEKLIPTGHKILIFSVMTRALDMIEYLLEYLEIQYERLDGSVASLDRQAAIDRFNDPESDSKIFLLSTKAGGQGINLCAADTVFIYDSDWNPQNDIQALSRAHRLGQTRKVMIYRFVARNSVEEKVIERTKHKMMVTNLVVKKYTNSEFHEILSFGTKELFNEDEETNKPIIYDDNAIEQLLDRNKECDSSTKGDLLSTCFSGFQVADYQYVGDVAESEEAEKTTEKTEEENSTNDKEPPPVVHQNYWEGILSKSVQKLKEKEEKTNTEELGKGKRKRRRLIDLSEMKIYKPTAEELVGVSDNEESEDSFDSASSEDGIPLGKRRNVNGVNKVMSSDMVSVLTDEDIPLYRRRYMNGVNKVMSSDMVNKSSEDFTEIATYGMDADLLKMDIAERTKYNNVVQKHHFSIICGFYPRERMAVYSALMNFGLPPQNLKKGDYWWPETLQHKSIEDMTQFIERLMNNLMKLDQATAHRFKDGDPRDPIDYEMLISRIGMMGMINFKVNYYNCKNDSLFEKILNHNTQHCSIIEEVELITNIIVEFYAKSHLTEFRKFEIFDGGFTELQSDWLDDAIASKKSMVNGTDSKPSSTDQKNAEAVTSNNNNIDGCQANGGNDNYETIDGVVIKTINSASVDTARRWSYYYDYLLLLVISVHGYDHFLDKVFVDPLFKNLLLPFRLRSLDIHTNNKLIRECLLIRLSLLEKALIIEAQLVRLSIALHGSINHQQYYIPLKQLRQLDTFFKSQTADSYCCSTTTVNSLPKSYALCQLELLINDIGKVRPNYVPIELRRIISVITKSTK